MPAEPTHADEPEREHAIAPVTEDDLADLLPLMRAYCDFYGESPSDEALVELSRTLIADPMREGIQLIARDPSGVAVGFASVFWSWDTTEAARIGIMNDLFVAPAARGLKLADRLIEGCMRCCAKRGASRLEWETAPENLRAQAVYARVGASREPWLVYVKQVTVAIDSPEAAPAESGRREG
ncbi:MAG TPA: GNAT family N-acetyltransferase [Solirubrobacteraceae bacterium]|jgi:GNAT superfamily N-acetyltransferase|nr:GNAT family N-acetyltransferase [Solirubrobacteraceae bacterium]